MLQSCPNCGSSNHQGYRFCSKCGANLSEDAGRPAGAPAAIPPALPEQSVDLGQASTIQAGETRRSWRFPVVAVSGLLLLVLAGIALYFTLAPGTRSIDVPGIEPPGVAQKCALKERASEEEELKRLICVSNEEQIWAMSTLNTEVLKGTRTGMFLSENVDVVERLKKQNIYGEPVNHELKILDVKVEGDRATVKTYEVWTVAFYQQSDKKLVQKHGPDAYHETYHMVRRDGKWLIERVDFVTQTPTTTN
jgi:hypothetical protein